MSFDPEKIYEKEESSSEGDLKIFFVSTGREEVIKVIQYAYVESYQNKEVYNLGFGDYDISTDSVNDNSSTNNYDGRMVLNTVLSTIPTFFGYFPDKMLFVQGSDSKPEFKEECKKKCRKKCGDHCRKFNQRIRIYRNYVDLNFEELNVDYQFFGGFRDESGQTFMQDYVPGREYSSVLLIKRNK